MRVSAVHSTKICPNGAEECLLAKATLHDAYRLSVMLVCTMHRVRACNGRHGHIHSTRIRMPPFVVLGAAHVGGGAFWICMRTCGGGLAAADFNGKNCPGRALCFLCWCDMRRNSRRFASPITEQCGECWWRCVLDMHAHLRRRPCRGRFQWKELPWPRALLFVLVRYAP